MKISIINGPNLNLLGEREPSVYGTHSMDEFMIHLQKKYPTIQFEYRQSNVEGELIDFLHEFRNGNDGIILNAGAYTHTSLALGDAVRSIHVPVIEVHLSQIFSRETYRHVSFISPACRGVISGFGWSGYEMAVLQLSNSLSFP